MLNNLKYRFQDFQKKKKYVSTFPKNQSLKTVVVTATTHPRKKEKEGERGLEIVTFASSRAPDYSVLLTFTPVSSGRLSIAFHPFTPLLLLPFTRTPVRGASPGASSFNYTYFLREPHSSRTPVCARRALHLGDVNIRNFDGPLDASGIAISTPSDREISFPARREKPVPPPPYECQVPSNANNFRYIYIIPRGRWINFQNFGFFNFRFFWMCMLYR